MQALLYWNFYLPSLIGMKTNIFFIKPKNTHESLFHGNYRLP